MMSEPKPNHLTEGWPNDPSRPEVEAFARELQNNLPELPAEAMQRIGGQMHDEMALLRWRKRRLRIAAGMSVVAATLLIGLGILQILDTPHALKQTPPDTLGVRGVPAVRDQYRVPVLATPVVPAPDPFLLLPPKERERFAANPAPRSDGPLIALDNHRTLFESD